ncbi:MAG: adenylyltransferase/cytidyltransferase family protein [Oscillospiraceae bacterium]|nr:adenylyltransferase/cytidyltransferase family protein [Oscillospiraceae bacterium]
MIYGFFGGKFLPMHRGHVYCIDTAARMCDHVTVILFYGGDEELRICAESSQPFLSLAFREEQMRRVCALYPNVECHTIDSSLLKLPDGTEDWDAETPLVRAYVPHMDYVYSSEPSYGAYFSRAYPEAQHIIVDAERKTYPISSTLIRAMQEMEEQQKWMV